MKSEYFESSRSTTSIAQDILVTHLAHKWSEILISDSGKLHLVDGCAAYCVIWHAVCFGVEQ